LRMLRRGESDSMNEMIEKPSFWRRHFAAASEGPDAQAHLTLKIHVSQAGTSLWSRHICDRDILATAMLLCHPLNHEGDSSSCIHVYALLAAYGMIFYNAPLCPLVDPPVLEMSLDKSPVTLQWITRGDMDRWTDGVMATMSLVWFWPRAHQNSVITAHFVWCPWRSKCIWKQSFPRYYRY
jgi:hypothetical protein